jgi:galactofuranosylgalactofuranosylrhamnosyl-N-acetylglucosaminyl-diphospho-decaprenol beta-1,5/1,6-galactofuranosyltransferase
VSTLARSQVAATDEQAGGPYRQVQRVVFPVDADLDTLPLYVDFNAFSGRPVQDDGQVDSILRQPAALHGDWLAGRRSISLPEGERVSMGTYFNAFPAAYWRRWTTATTSRLAVSVEGRGAVTVYRSNARGNAQRVAYELVDGPAELVFDLPLAPFGDGGWYWFDLSAGTGRLTLREAGWSVPAGRSRTGTGTVAVTTFNRPDYCLALIRSLADAPDTLARIDQLLVVDQGHARLVDQAGFADAAALLGDRLRVLRQANLGGSGGFARGMQETLGAGRSDYVLLLDDDVVVEPEGILRAMDLADLARRPTIVGGHMFNMYERSVLHSYGERVHEWRFFWGPVTGTHESHDFAQRNLREVAWLHRRTDVDYNGWWMCLIPRAVLREIGLALPLFIKWDDAEFGLRAKAAGIPTVTLPGVAVWHIPWSDKDDAVDWQAYFHQRNRLVAALLHSPYERGGQLLRESFQNDVKHLLSLQYSTLELRLRALEDLLAGPQRLHPDIIGKLAEVRAVRGVFPDAQVQTDPGAFPPPRRRRPPRRGKEPQEPRSRAGRMAVALTGALRQLRPVPTPTDTVPEAVVPAMDARWWRLSHLDSAVVSTADGTGASWYRRQPQQFRTMLVRSLRLHQELLHTWPELARDYRAALPEIVSPQQWSRTFQAAGSAVDD